jgi:hypothetical protein
VINSDKGVSGAFLSLGYFGPKENMRFAEADALPRRAGIIEADFRIGTGHAKRDAIFATHVAFALTLKPLPRRPARARTRTKSAFPFKESVCPFKD